MPILGIYLCSYATCMFQDSEIFGTYVYYFLAKVNVSWDFWTNTSGEDKPSQVQYVLFSWKSNQSFLCLNKLFPAILQERLRLTCLM